MTYQATTLENLKPSDSGIDVRVDAMLLFGKTDGNGGFICSLAKDGELVPAMMSNHLYDEMESSPGIYEVTGEWNGKRLEVHSAEIEHPLENEKVYNPTNLYNSDSSVPTTDYLRKMKSRFQ